MRFWCWATALLFLATPGRAYAHAFAQRYDLPLPLWLYLSGAGATVAVSFVLVALFVRRSPQVLPEPRLELLQTAVGRFVAHPIVLFVIRLASVAIFFTLIAAGLLGIQSDAFDNILPTAVWVIWWVGLAFVAALLGDLWSLVNPWRIVAEWVAQLARGRDRTVEPPVGSSMWPAVGLFAGFAWAELVWPDRAIPANLAVAILLYSGITWLGMYYWGIENWLRRGEAFAALFRLFARFAPLEMRVVTGGSGSRGAVADAGSFRTARRADRRLYLRPYAVGLLTQFVPPASVLFFVLLVLSTVSFDGFAETPAWLNLFQWIVAIPAIGELPNAVGLDNANTLLRTAGLIATPIVFFAVYLLVCSIIALVIPRSHLSEIDGAPARWTAFGLARLFVLTLVPIAIAYHLAHFISLLLIFGQQIIPLISDPFGFGWNLFGTADYQVDIAIVSARFVWFFSIGAIVIGHIAAVYLAHVMALRAFGEGRAARRSQYPMLVLMVGYTMLSLWILAQPIVEGNPEFGAVGVEGGEFLNAVNYPPGPDAPSVRISLLPDPDEGWNLQLETTNFRFTPENVGRHAVPFEGYAQLYIDNIQVDRIYGHWAHIAPLPPGPHEIMVVLSANDHRTYLTDGVFIKDVVQLVVSDE